MGDPAQWSGWLGMPGMRISLPLQTACLAMLQGAGVVDEGGWIHSASWPLSILTLQVADPEKLKGRTRTIPIHRPSDICCSLLPSHPPTYSGAASLSSGWERWLLGFIFTNTSIRGTRFAPRPFNSSKMEILCVWGPLGLTSPVTFCSKKHGKRKM